MQKRMAAHIVFACAFACILFLSHSGVLNLPYFWDEMGQFIPAALDIQRDGAWIPRTTLPNVHPPGVMAYLATVWQLFGYSVVNTRVAMLLLATAGVMGTFLLAVELGKPLSGAPAFIAVLLLMASPLFWAQAMLAQLDMPAMVFSLFAILLFLRGRTRTSALLCICAVLAKETSLVVPAFLGASLLWERRWTRAVWFTLPAFAIAGWLFYLKSQTGHVFGNAEFTHYNLTFQWHPVRLGLTLLRRVFYLFIDNFHWIGSIALLAAWQRTRIFRTRQWAIVGAIFVAQALAVTVLGGAALERYLMPVLPLFYIAVAAALTTLQPFRRNLAIAIMTAGLIIGIFVNSPFTLPYENNTAFVDFVRLQKLAAEFVETEYRDSTVLSAWPFPDALRRPEFGYVSRPVRTVGLENFNVATVVAARGKGDVLVLYSRTWEPSWSLARFPSVKKMLTDYYFYEPQITAEQLERELGLVPVARWERGGQWIEVYAKSRTPNIMVL